MFKQFVSLSVSDIVLSNPCFKESQEVNIVKTGLVGGVVAVSVFVQE
jgi:hypothetical protein